MNLYMWRSKAMADYYDGDIIVMAKDTKSARAKVLRVYRKRTECPNYNIDAVKKDLKKDPTIVPEGAIFLTGGS